MQSSNKIDFSQIDTIIKNTPEQIKRIILSNPITTSEYAKIKIRPVLSENSIVFHAEQFTKKQSFQRNFSNTELILFLHEMTGIFFKQTLIETKNENITCLTNKKGHTTILRKAASVQAEKTPFSLTEQNRKKKYILREGTPIPFLVQLGVMTKEGKVISQKYDKFRQINRFLEYIDDILDTILLLPDGTKKKDISVIDFGCGKSYLTFAVYYYLTTIKKLTPHIVGLDLKEDVIVMCNTLAKEFGYQNLDFLTGDIASYTGEAPFDLMITLHACDTATDYALAQAVRWKTSAILSVPCCQHEINKQLSNTTISNQFTSLLKFGIIKERFAALATDVMRAELLEQNGYDVQLLEFIDMTHTPKNLLIRAVRSTEKAENNKTNTYELFKNALAVKPLLEELL